MAPDGYEVAKDVKFTVNSDGSVTEVVMYDESKPDTPSSPGSPSTPGSPNSPSTPDTPNTPDKPTTPEKPSAPERVTTITAENPRTGSDAANIAFVGMIIACAVMVISAVAKKKDDEE